MAKKSSYTNNDDSDPDAKFAFGEKVRSAMNNLGMRQSDLARASGLRRDSISNYVRGLTWPDPDNFRKLANALNMTVHELCPGMSEINTITKSRQGGVPRQMVRHLTSFIQPEQPQPGHIQLKLDQPVTFAKAALIFDILKE